MTHGLHKGQDAPGKMGMLIIRPVFAEFNKDSAHVEECAPTCSPVREVGRKRVSMAVGVFAGPDGAWARVW